MTVGLAVPALLFDGDRREPAADDLVHRRGAAVGGDSPAEPPALPVERGVREGSHLSDLRRCSGFGGLIAERGGFLVLGIADDFFDRRPTLGDDAPAVLAQ